MYILKTLLIIATLVCSCHTVFIPELFTTVTSDFLNKQIAVNYGSNISDLINKANIKDLPPIDQKVDGVHIRANLTNIKQKININWNTNILFVTGRHNFTIKSKGVNISLDADLEFKIGLTPKQKGNLTIEITKLETDTYLYFAGSHCPISAGFDVQVSSIYANSQSFDVNIKDKTLDNKIIAILEKYIRPRVPQLLNDIAETRVNPFLSNLTCTSVESTFGLGNQSYIATINTTTVPQFNSSTLLLPIDLTLTNLVSNLSNVEVENQNMPLEQTYAKVSNVTVIASSNLLQTITWLLQDSFILHTIVTNDMLGPDPPIALNTLNLSILMPQLNKMWPNKSVVLLVTPSSQFSSVIIRSGRMPMAISMSIKFVVNNTDKSGNVTDCLMRGDCIQACDLNFTIALSVAINVQANLLQGLIQSLNIYSIDIISSLIDINLKSLLNVINSIVVSLRPSINQMLQNGIVIDLSKITKQYGLNRVDAKVFLDYVAAGLRFDL